MPYLAVNIIHVGLKLGYVLFKLPAPPCCLHIYGMFFAPSIERAVHLLHQEGIADAIRSMFPHAWVDKFTIPYLEDLCNHKVFLKYRVWLHQQGLAYADP